MGALLNPSGARQQNSSTLRAAAPPTSRSHASVIDTHVSGLQHAGDLAGTAGGLQRWHAGPVACAAELGGGGGGGGGTAAAVAKRRSRATIAAAVQALGLSLST